jgi:hypothetical protein
MSINDDAKLRLEDDLKSLEDLKQTQEKRYKFQVTKLDSQLKHLNHELQILGVKLKEKDQEVKLNDLKIKELKKQVPNTRLKPIGGDQMSSVSRKEIAQRSNMSVDSKMGDETSMVGE